MLGEQPGQEQRYLEDSSGHWRTWALLARKRGPLKSSEKRYAMVCSGFSKIVLAIGLKIDQRKSWTDGCRETGRRDDSGFDQGGRRWQWRVVGFREELISKWSWGIFDARYCGT